MEVLLDTSVLIDTLRFRKGRRELLASVVNDGHVLSTTAINIAEVYVGLRSGEETRTAALLKPLRSYPLDLEMGIRAGLIANTWAKKGKTISLPDAIIAATALDQGCVLMTDNREDFPMPELALFPLA